MNKSKNNIKLQDLIWLIRRLRSPEGCPWDRVQTPSSIETYVIEECHELIDALHTNNEKEIVEELGDLIFQILFLIEMFEEDGRFGLKDVLETVYHKMISRHPHVFGNEKVKSIDDVRVIWHRQKKNEKSTDFIQQIDSVPKNLPSLLRAYRITERASQVGFDWEKGDEVLEKLEEEIAELKDAKKKNESKADMEEEIGDILFTIVNLSRFLRVNPERALQLSIHKFISRLHWIDKVLKEKNISWEDASMSLLDTLWEKAKDKGKNKNE